MQLPHRHTRIWFAIVALAALPLLGSKNGGQDRDLPTELAGRYELTGAENTGQSSTAPVVLNFVSPHLVHVAFKDEPPGTFTYGRMPNGEMAGKYAFDEAGVSLASARSLVVDMRLRGDELRLIFGDSDALTFRRAPQ